MKFPQNQKWESIKARELNKRIEQKKNEFTQRNNLNEIKKDKWEDFQEANSKANTDKKGESSSEVWVLSNAHLGKLFKMGFWAFIYPSFQIPEPSLHYNL